MYKKIIIKYCINILLIKISILCACVECFKSSYTYRPSEGSFVFKKKEKDEEKSYNVILFCHGGRGKRKGRPV